MWKRIKRWWDAEGALVGLQGVSDRMLEDMGLERADLRQQVLGYQAGPLTTDPCACLPTGKLAQS